MNYLISNPEHRKNLATLARFLHELSEHKVNMDAYVSGSTEYKYLDTDMTVFDVAGTAEVLKHDCNTSACALGWAAFMPEFRKVTEQHIGTYYAAPHYSKIGYELFGISDISSEYSSSSSLSGFLFGPSWKNEENTAQAAAKRIVFALKQPKDTFVFSTTNYTNYTQIWYSDTEFAELDELEL